MVQMLNVPATWVHLNKTKINYPKKNKKQNLFNYLLLVSIVMVLVK